jgi:deoxyuridine 5'-triphosphate nucleotidohydrolase
MINVGAGVVDFDYRGEVGVVLFNHGLEDFPVAPGDRVAQLILEKVVMGLSAEVEALQDTARGAGGFGSTGTGGIAEVATPAHPTAASKECEVTECLLVKRLREEAVLPVRGSTQAAGFDLAAADAAVVPAGGKACVKTGLAVAVPEGTYGRIAPRSGLAVKKFLNAGAGVVDFDYRGEVGVVLFNHGLEDFPVAPGDRVAQLILEKVAMVGSVEVESLEATARGAGGFGSTGLAPATNGATAGTSSPSADMSANEKHVAMQVQRTHPAATLPTRGSVDAAGFDISAAEATIVKAGGKALVKTGLKIAIPACTYARIAPRSGLALKRMIHVGAGVVDADYRGEVGVVIFNHGPEDFAVEAGDRIAQLILEQVSMVPCAEVASLEDTVRGAGGFGSTGVAAKEQVGDTPEPCKRQRTCDDDPTPAKEQSINTSAAEVEEAAAKRSVLPSSAEGAGALRAA